MDEKHRQYCIRLGNPYMQEESFKEQVQAQGSNVYSIQENNMKPDDWIKNNKRFTN